MQLFRKNGSKQSYESSKNAHEKNIHQFDDDDDDEDDIK